MENNNVVLSENVQKAVDNLGQGTIMGDLQSISNDETNKQLTDLKKSIVENNVREEETTETAVNNVAISGGVPSQNITQYIPKKVKQLVRRHKKIGRNELCPCGSGKKYKNCCLESGQFEGYQEVG